MNIEDKIITKKRFCDMVESYVFDKRQSYMDAVIDIMTENHIEPERVGVLINRTFKEPVKMFVSSNILFINVESTKISKSYLIYNISYCSLVTIQEWIGCQRLHLCFRIPISHL